MTTPDHLSDTRFDSLDLDQCLLDALNDLGYQNCTPIQALTLPLTLKGTDMAGQGQTGTGKSAAFLLATFHHLLTKPASDQRRKTQPRAVIMAPTRELAIQIHKDAQQLGKYTGLKVGVVYGGSGYEQQRKMLEDGLDVLIGTPGRMLDYHKQRVFDFRAVQAFVLDEADRMFDMGFIKDVRFVMRRLPPVDKRLSMLFSATLSHRVMELAYEHMNNPEKRVVEAEQMTADRVRQAAYYVSNDEKIPLLIGLLQAHDASRTIVFVNTKHVAETVCQYLLGNDIEAEVLSGDVPQNKRQRFLKDFQAGTLKVLVATDVAARGLHIPGVSHVINYDLPDDPEDYVHRIGRTARAGEEGDAISLVCETYAFSLMDIEEYIEMSLGATAPDPELIIEPKPKKRRPKHTPHGQQRGQQKQGQQKQGQGGNKGRNSNNRGGGNSGNNRNQNSNRNGGQGGNQGGSQGGNKGGNRNQNGGGANSGNKGSNNNRNRNNNRNNQSKQQQPKQQTNRQPAEQKAATKPSFLERIGLKRRKRNKDKD